jgi:hypothetical protein
MGLVTVAGVPLVIELHAAVPPAALNALFESSLHLQGRSLPLRGTS